MTPKKITLKYFQLSEFICPCCGQQHMQQKVLEMLDHAREIADIPFSITSGWRCRTHNKNVNGKPGSAHLYGKAVDISAIGSRVRFKVIRGLIQAGFIRIGIGTGFIHADNDATKDSEVIWLY